MTHDEGRPRSSRWPNSMVAGTLSVFALSLIGAIPLAVGLLACAVCAFAGAALPPRQ